MEYLLIFLFLFSLPSAWALPECEGYAYKGDDLSKIKHLDNCDGTHTINDGDKYVGEYQDRLPNGQWTFVCYSGNKYIGKFKDDKYNGQGTITFPDGRIIEWQRKNNKYVEKKNINMKF